VQNRQHAHAALKPRRLLKRTVQTRRTAATPPSPASWGPSCSCWTLQVTDAEGVILDLCVVFECFGIHIGHNIASYRHRLHTIFAAADAAGPAPTRGDPGVRADFQPSRTRAMLSRVASMRIEAELMFLVAKCQWTWPQTFGGMSAREAARVLMAGTYEEIPVGGMVSETGSSQNGLVIVLSGCIAVRKKSVKPPTTKTLGDNYGGCVHVIHRDGRWGSTDALQYASIETFKTFDFSVLPPPPPDIPLPASRQGNLRAVQQHHPLQQQEQLEQQQQQQQLREQHWLYQQRLNTLVTNFDPRYDRIPPETDADATKQRSHKVVLPQSRLQRLRMCIRAAFLCKNVLCAHVMSGATVAGLHHPELWSAVDVSVLAATKRMSVGGSAAAAGHVPRARTRCCSPFKNLRLRRITEQVGRRQRRRCGC
jgi:hypothetical protein